MKFLKNLLIIISLITLDILSKIFSKQISFFNYTENTGIAFGLFKGNNLIFTIITLIIIAVIVYFYKDKNFHLGFNFILAGALGNLISRLYYGFVIDFIDLKFWPVFNFADVFIIIGIFLLIFKIHKER